VTYQLEVTASDAASIKITILISPEEIAQASKKGVDGSYRTITLGR
jgi:hypothetical protein